MAWRTRELGSEQWARWWRESGERELRQVLFWRWDPLGVDVHFPSTADEYDRYLSQVGSLLRKEASQAEIADYLGTVEREQMGIHETQRAEGHRREVARIIVDDWYPESQGYWQEFGPSQR